MHRIVSSTLQDGCSPLYMASAAGHIEVVDELLRSGAPPNPSTTVRNLVYLVYIVYLVLV